MLILTRQATEGHDEVIITVPPASESSQITIKILKGSVKLGFEAPEEISIVRSELLGEPKYP